MNEHHSRAMVPATLMAVAAVVWPASQAGAQELSLSISAGAAYSDNIQRANDAEESDTTADVGLRLGLAREQGRLNASIASDLLFRTYLDDTYDDEIVGGLDGTLAYWFVPEAFSWVVEDHFGQTFIEPRAVETPDNRQSTNYFSTGPDVLVPVGDRTDLSVSARWADASYEETEADNQRLSGTLGLIRRQSSRASWSINGTAERVEYDDALLNSDYDRQTAYLGFDATGARTTLNLRAGYAFLHDGGETSDAPLVSLALLRRVSSRSTLRLDAGTNLIDSAEAFRRDRTIGGIVVGNEDTVVSQDPYQSDYATLGWTVESSRATITLSADWRQEDHERNDTLNRDAIGADVLLSRRLGSTLTASLNGGWSSEDFQESGIDFDEWSAGVEFGWILGPNYSLTLRGDHYDGSGSSSVGTGVRDYEENRISVRVTFTPRR